MTVSPGWPEATRAITAAFDAGWRTAPDGPLRTPVHWPNTMRFEPPQDGAWVRLSVQWGAGHPAAIGRVFYRYAGVVQVQVFVPQGTGNALLDTLCEAAATIFGDGVSLQADGRLQFWTPSRLVVGPDGLWWQENVVCSFRRERKG